MKQVFCISGLGADERAFRNLQVDGVAFTCLKWLQPNHRESIGNYAKRMTEQVKEESPVLMGLSFGGMMALEMARHLPTKKVILVSSIKSASELPKWMKLSGRLKLNRFAPPRPWKWLSGIENNFLGAEGPEERKLANEFRETVDPEYLRWALDQVLNWQNTWQPASLYHLHGNNDKTFPIKYIRPTHLVDGGGHFMIMNRAPQINAILEKILVE